MNAEHNGKMCKKKRRVAPALNSAFLKYNYLLNLCEKSIADITVEIVNQHRYCNLAGQVRCAGVSLLSVRYECSPRIQ